MDEKGRWTVPVNFREFLGVHFWITLDNDDNIVALPLGRWEKLQDQMEMLLASYPDSEHLMNAIDRTHIFADEIDASTDWRIPLAEPIREKAQLTREVVTVGALDRVVVWDRDKFFASQKYDHPDTLKLQRLILRGAPVIPAPLTRVDTNGNAETPSASSGEPDTGASEG
ncbi:MAG: hypothetical protein HY318_16305 [Armatimonadetes bacterium]|nr:hypothetical protein [Armatimonadota bacterium]